MTPEEFMEIQEGLDQLIAVISSYKAKLVDAGFAPENAEYMALEFHSLYLENHLEISGTVEDQ